MAGIARGKPDLWSLAAFIALTLGGGTALGVLTGPDAWYSSLTKPAFNPPNWVFGPVWSVLYVLIGIAGWLVWTSGRPAAAVKLWWAQLALNFLWSPLFFTMHGVGMALIVILLLLVTIWAFVWVTASQHPGAAVLFVPYGLWVGFATLLNGYLYVLNR